MDVVKSRNYTESKQEKNNDIFSQKNVAVIFLAIFFSWIICEMVAILFSSMYFRDSVSLWKLIGRNGTNRLFLHGEGGYETIRSISSEYDGRDGRGHLLVSGHWSDSLQNLSSGVIL